MSQCEATRQSDDIRPPIHPVVIALTANTVQVVDLTTILTSQQRPELASVPKGTEHTAPFDTYLTFLADAAAGIAFGPTAASLSGVLTTATSTITAAGAVTDNANTMILLTAGVPFPVRVPAGSSQNAAGDLAGYGTSSPARFVALLATANTNVRFWASSG